MSIRFQNIPIFQNLNLFEKRWCFMANRLIILILCKCQNGYTELKWSALEDFRRLTTGFRVLENFEIRECRYPTYLRDLMTMKACDSNSPSSKVNCLFLKLAFSNRSFFNLAKLALTIRSWALGRLAKSPESWARVHATFFGVVLTCAIFQYSDGNQNSMRAIRSEPYGKKHAVSDYKNRPQDVGMSHSWTWLTDSVFCGTYSLT